jgi:RNase P subunit RPR2
MGAWYTSQPFTRSGSSFVVTCKRCTRAIPAGVDAFPRDNIVVSCPLCGEKRRYRPVEVFLGWIDTRVAEQNASLRNHRPGYRKPPQRSKP